MQKKKVNENGERASRKGEYKMRTKPIFLPCLTINRFSRYGSHFLFSRFVLRLAWFESRQMLVLALL